MTALVSTRCGAASDRGHRRELNEDAFLAVAPVFVIADGMGGHAAGEVASQRVVDAFSVLVGRPEVSPEELEGALAVARRLVTDIAPERGRAAGTTVSGAVLAEQGGTPYWLVLNVGDSRTYRMADGLLEQVSVDHSEVQERVDCGELTAATARTDPRRNVVTRALGAGVDSRPDFWLLPVRRHDRLLICSDGLTGELDDAQITVVLGSEPDPQRAAAELVARALASGGRDNVTVLVVDATAVLDGAPDDEPTAPRAVVVLAGPGADEDTAPRRLPRGGAR